MARDKNEKVWIGGGAVAALLVAGATWSFVVSPKLSDVDSLRSQTSDAQTQNITLNANVSKLKDQYTHISEVRKQLAAAQAQLPADSGMSALTTQLSAQARANHVSITQFTATDPTPVGVASTAPAATESTSAAPAPDAATAAPSGNYSIAVTLSVNGSQANDLAFARAVQQQGPRIALVSSVQLASGSAGTGATSGSGGTTMTLQLDVFVAPPAPAAAPTATPTTAP